MTPHPAAPLQSAMLAATRARPGAYLQQVAVTFPAGAGSGRIEPAFRALAGRFPALRQEFTASPGGLVLVRIAGELRLDGRELDGPAPAGAGWEEWLAQDRREPLTGHRLRVWPESRVALWTFPHALLDGRSTARVVRAWIDEVQGQSPDPGAPWQPWVPFPEDGVRGVVERWAGRFPPEAEEAPPERGDHHSATRFVDADLAVLAGTLGVTVHTLAQVTAALVVGRLLDRSHVVLGQVRACGPAGAAGFWINTVPLVLAWRGDDPVRVLAARVREASRELRDLAGLAPDQWLARVRPHTRQPWDAVLVSERGDLEHLVGRTGARVVLHERSDDPLVLAAYLGRTVQVQVESTVLPERLVRWIADTWSGLLAGLPRNLGAPCGTLVPAGEDAETPLREPPVPLHAAFEAIVRVHHDRPAILGSARVVTYGRLAEAVARLATALAVAGVAAGERVAVWLADRALWPATLLATQRLGAVFVPLDPGHPAARLDQLWRDADPRLLVSDVPPWRPGIPCLDPRSLPALAAEAPPRPGAVPPAGSTAALLYTSGSTGEPKGVRLAGEAIATEARALGRLVRLQPEDRVLQFASPGFDAFLEEVFLALLHGAALVPRDPSSLADFETFTRFLEREAVTVADLPTAFWRGWAGWLAREPGRFPPRLRVVIIGGEAATEGALAAWQAAVPGGCQLWNTYGPTEATIIATAQLLSGGGALPPGDPPIGRPLEGVRVRVAGDHGVARPAGLPGELWISGTGVSPGYWGRPDLDATAFVWQEGRRWYRTGDRVAWNDAGELVFLGRTDGQIKLRGHRLEPEEIRRQAERVPGVAAAHIGLAGDPPRLLAWIVTTTAGVDLAETVRTALAAALPPAMVPSQVVPVDALPLTSRGKVDRARLPLPAAPGDRVAVEDPMVAWVCRLFAGVLRRPLPEVEPAVDFQRQGGDSILAMELVLGLRDAGLAVEPGDLARDSSPRAIARRFSGATTPAVDHWEPVVVLRPGRAGVPPLVLIHATPGDVLGYGNLAAALPDDLPCWGIVSRALHEPGRPHRTIPEMAVAYLEAIRARRGGAPFALGGWCYGGLVAYEMACLLHRTGQPAPLRLVLIETGSPPPAGLRATLRWHLLRARALLGQRPSRLAGYLRRKVALRRADTAVDPAPSTPRRSATVAWNMAAVRQYRAGPYPLPLDLFLTADPGSDTLALPDGGWTVLAPVRTVHPCAGGHADLLHPPHVATLAARLAARLGQGSAS